ncbi:MAG: DUF4974 domain-containing protein [Cyclobacteriaceae bacterium]|nr:DUF4974 domain-containing protein [Cyclobacteriaceae bacterium]
MKEEYFLDLIARQLSGEALSEKEMTDLRQVLSSDNELKNLYETVKNRWKFIDHGLKVDDTEAAFREVESRLFDDSIQKRNESASRNIFQRHNDSPRRLSWQKIAAIVVFFISAVFVVSLVVNQKSFEKPAAITHIIKSNPKGQKSTITLPDGSKVKLNSESILEYDSDFENQRDVHLIGQAFFEIQRDTTKPFTVHIGELGVRVLGTSFDVKAYPFDESVSVSVLTGKVAVKKQNNYKSETLGQLLPTQQMEINHSSGHTNIRTFDPDKILAWKDGILFFQSEKLVNTFKELERWYGVKINIQGNPNLGLLYSGKFESESLENVLESMRFSYSFDYTIDSTDVYIIFN